jgi:uncharacterized protein (TIGR01777 family)
MRFFLIGGTGFVGIPLIRHLLKSGHTVTALARSASKAENLPPGTLPILGDPMETGSWQERAAESDVIVNMVGKPIMTRWTGKAREEIMSSRIRSTRMAVEAIPRDRASGMTLINANAVGYYDGAGDTFVAENGPAGKGFLAEVARAWQAEAEDGTKKGARVVIARLGAIVGRGGGVLAQMLPPFQLGIGGRLGSGRQWFSWMHLHDLCRAMLFVAGRQDISGPVNMCSPNPVTNRELTRTLSRILGRPAILPVPGFVLRLAIGGAAEIALDGQRIVPAVLEKAGFAFDFPTLEETLVDLLGK